MLDQILYKVNEHSVTDHQ